MALSPSHARFVRLRGRGFVYPCVYVRIYIRVEGSGILSETLVVQLGGRPIWSRVPRPRESSPKLPAVGCRRRYASLSPSLSLVPAFIVYFCIGVCIPVSFYFSLVSVLVQHTSARFFV